VGFEPTVAQRTTTVFETAPFNHSGTSPSGIIPGGRWPSKGTGEWHRVVLDLYFLVELRIGHLVDARLAQLFGERLRRSRFAVNEEDVL
jgi:hypothetical protein